MADAIAAAATTAAAWVADASYAALTSIGVGVETAAVISSYAASITAITVVTLAQVGPALLFRPSVPTPEFARQVKRQAIPDRVSGYGRVRVGGAYMLFETDGTNEGLALNVFAMHDGLIAGWNDIYLNDDKVTVMENTYVESGADMRYGKFSDLVRIETRLGLPTETNYGTITAIKPDLWPATARGDGVASLMMIAKAKFKENFARDYPYGFPIPSAVGDLQYCWDPRLGARGTITDDSDKAESATWVGGSQNPILQLLDFMTNPETGMGLPLSRFLPVIEGWETAADVCDEAVALAGGGTINRYLSGGVYMHSTAPADVIATILATCDGWLAQDANGCFVVQAGKYYEPTFIIRDEHIVALQRQFFLEDEKASNEMIVSFTDPAFDYTEVEADPWRNEDDIEARGDVRSQRLSLPWVQNNSQARRLGKIALSKASAPIRGTVTMTLDGLRGWSERRARIQAPSDSETMADIVVDLLPLTLNPDMTVSIPFVSCDQTAYDWDTDEEGTGAGDDTRPPVEAVPIPVITSIDVLQGDGGTTRLRIFIGDPPEQTYVARWRVDGEEGWVTEAEQISTEGVVFPFIDTALVTPVALEVQVSSVSAGGSRSDWSVSFVVDASVPTLMGKPTNFGAYPIGAGVSATLEITARAPNHPDVDHLIFYASIVNDYGTAGDISGEMPAAGLDFVNYSYTSGAGGFYLWVEAFDAADVGSGPLGPIYVVAPA